jgi:uncharacterized protein YbbC (DUF1343 family)
MYPKEFEFHSDYFDKIVGSSSVRLSLKKNVPASEIILNSYTQIEAFSHQRKSFLFYSAADD